MLYSKSLTANAVDRSTYYVLFIVFFAESASYDHAQKHFGDICHATTLEFIAAICPNHEEALTLTIFFAPHFLFRSNSHHEDHQPPSRHRGRTPFGRNDCISLWPPPPQRIGGMVIASSRWTRGIKYHRNLCRLRRFLPLRLVRRLAFHSR